jgi:hypothetical protein
MGGYGSGRPSYRGKAVEHRSSEINRLHREGCLRAGWSGHWVWSRDGEAIGKIGIRAESHLFNLDYRVRQYGDDWETVKQSIRLIHADCHYGGQRPYFICPGVVTGRHCARRVGKLFLGHKYFLCRHCCNLAYASQSESRHDRMLRRANKLRAALGGEAGTANWIAPKPKGMWDRTYQRKRLEIEWCENQADRLFLKQFSHLLNREEREIFFEK